MSPFDVDEPIDRERLREEKPVSIGCLFLSRCGDAGCDVCVGVCIPVEILRDKM